MGLQSKQAIQIPSTAEGGCQKHFFSDLILVQKSLRIWGYFLPPLRMEIEEESSKNTQNHNFFHFFPYYGFGGLGVGGSTYR